MTSPAGLSVIGFALLLGLSLFFGLAFEEFNIRSGLQRPGGVRTFPLLALAGGLLYVIDTQRFLPLVAGLLILGAWLAIAYRHQLRDISAEQRSVELVAPVCNVLAYLIGPVALALPPWVAVAAAVAAVVLLTWRDQLHALAERVEVAEIGTAAKFLILTGIVLPLLPNEPVTTLTAITPYKAWLALLAVCTLSYASYLLQRFLAPSNSAIAVALLGGLYSSTATTVVLARAAGEQPARSGSAQAGMMLATSVMYLRTLVIVAIFDWGLAQSLALVMGPLFAVAVIVAMLQYRVARRLPAAARQQPAATGKPPRNPLEITAAAFFARAFRRDLDRDGMGARALRRGRRQHAGGGGGLRRYRPLRAEHRAGRQRLDAGADRRNGDPHRRRLEQHSEGELCRRLRRLAREHQGGDAAGRARPRRHRRERALLTRITRNARYSRRPNWRRALWR